MFRVSLANAFAKRTLRPLLEKHQATPLAVTLSADETDDIYSGMVAALRSDGTVEIADDDTTNPFGLFALDRNSVINDTDGQPADGSSVGTTSGRAFAVWQGGPDAYFRLDLPAFEEGSYTAGDALYVSSAGKLTNSGSGTKVGTVVEVVSSSRLVVRIGMPQNL